MCSDEFFSTKQQASLHDVSGKRQAQIEHIIFRTIAVASHKLGQWAIRCTMKYSDLDFFIIVSLQYLDACS